MPDALPPSPSDRFLDALVLGREVHGHQLRKGGSIPYVAHLLAVAALVLEDGGDEDEAIAALLHDTVEDGGGPPMLERIRAQFGERVAAIVAACSDADRQPKPPWRERKQAYLAHLYEARDEGVLRVALADKLHSARALLFDYRESGLALWERFNESSPREQLWYYGGLVKLFTERRPGPRAEELGRAIAELARLVARDQASEPGPLRVFLDDDLHDRRAPEGWIHVRTAQETIGLLDTERVVALSLDHDLGDDDAFGTGRQVVLWLVEQDVANERDLWPKESIAVHSSNFSYGTQAMVGDIDRYCGLPRVGGKREWRAGGRG